MSLSLKGTFFCFLFFLLQQKSRQKSSDTKKGHRIDDLEVNKIDCLQ